MRLRRQSIRSLSPPSSASNEVGTNPHGANRKRTAVNIIPRQAIQMAANVSRRARSLVPADLDLDGDVAQSMQAAEAAFVVRRRQWVVRDQRDHGGAMAGADLPQMQ